jgi:hypothetical protein
LTLSHHQTHDHDRFPTDDLTKEHGTTRSGVEEAYPTYVLYKPLIDTLEAYPVCLKVSRGPENI